MLGFDPDTYYAVISVTSKYGGSELNKWLNAKTKGKVPRNFTKLAEALKTTLLFPNIRDNAINSLVALNQVNKTFPEYAWMLNDFERRSHADINDMEWIRLREVGFKFMNLSRSDTMRVLLVHLSW
jgi:hypothetical protein